MATYVIERTIPGAGQLAAQELQVISAKSVQAIEGIGPGLQWLHSYVTGDKIYCVHEARDAEVIREHARRGGFPADVVAQIATVIGPATAEG